MSNWQKQKAVEIDPRRGDEIELANENEWEKRVINSRAMLNVANTIGEHEPFLLGPGINGGEGRCLCRIQ